MTTDSPSEAIQPWIRAETIEWPFAYWAPLSGFPARTLERQWLSHILAGLSDYAASRSLVAHPFLSSHVVHRHFRDLWRTRLMELLPMIVYGRRPWEPPPAHFSDELLAQVMDPQQPFPEEKIQRGMYYWCHCSAIQSFAENFAGYGGLIFLFAETQDDPLAQLPPALLENPFLQQHLGSPTGRAALKLSSRMQAPWASKLKSALLKGWENFVDCEHIPVILPCFHAVDFVSLPTEVHEAVLAACPIYFRESPEDGGVLLAAPESLDSVLADLQSRWTNQQQRNCGHND
ncbi:MAG: hypothetical protein ACP5UT_11255 [Bryobacteraceae bacterium]